MKKERGEGVSFPVAREVLGGIKELKKKLFHFLLFLKAILILEALYFFLTSIDIFFLRFLLISIFSILIVTGFSIRKNLNLLPLGGEFLGLNILLY
ncbi:MAG: hypothetical protein CM15mP12_6370 [Gammaproteobacteria bacterium]|nr:MAG: hypothetical protein CM15mP12_6370 [Gammaproteobacteria bacterium]